MLGFRKHNDTMEQVRAAGGEHDARRSLDVGLSPDACRQIYVSLDLPPNAVPVIGITSAIAGEGRTTVALGLAETLAADIPGTALLVEVDLARPVLAQHYGLAPSPGLLDVLREEEDFTLEEVMQPVTDNLFVVPVGSRGLDGPRLLRQLALQDPFHSIANQPDVIILDLPAILNHSYSSLVAQLADAFVLVVRAGVTPVDIVREALGRLEDRLPHGVVLNGARSSLPAWWPHRSV